MKCGILLSSQFSQFPKKWVPERKYTLHEKIFPIFILNFMPSNVPLLLYYETGKPKFPGLPSPTHSLRFSSAWVLTHAKFFKKLAQYWQCSHRDFCTVNEGEFVVFRIPLCNKQHILMCSILLCINAFSIQLEKLTINCKIPCPPDSALKPLCFIARVLQVYFLWQIFEMSLAQPKGQMPAEWSKTL